MSALPEKARCSWCGKLKPLKELNRYDPITGDDSQAHCACIDHCDSDQAREIKDEVLKHLYPEEEDHEHRC